MSSDYRNEEATFFYNPSDSSKCQITYRGKTGIKHHTGTEAECELKKAQWIREEAITSGGVKDDTGKPGMYLLPYASLAEIAKVLDFGAKKYAPGNWAKGIAYSRLISAAERHLGAFKDGEDVDSESKLSHIAHLGCCVLFLMWMVLKRPDMDDRWSKEIRE